LIEGLRLYHLPSQANLPEADLTGAFVLQTCQRTLVVGHGLNDSLIPKLRETAPILATEDLVHTDLAAYQFLLETITGLKSQVLAESEITAQFKTAYQNYLSKPDRSTTLMTILEKLFKDAKEVRSRYLLEVGQQSYAGITRKILTSKVKTKTLVHVIGSGGLARDVLKTLSRRFDLSICARNLTAAQEIASQYQISHGHWDELPSLSKAPYLINTVGADEILFNDAFFREWTEANPVQRLFIDLSSPSVIDTSLTKKDGIIRLEDVFGHGVILSEEKQRKVDQARVAIKELVQKRHKSFRLQTSFVREELSFA